MLTYKDEFRICNITGFTRTRPPLILTGSSSGHPLINWDPGDCLCPSNLRLVSCVLAKKKVGFPQNFIPDVYTGWGSGMDCKRGYMQKKTKKKAGPSPKIHSRPLFKHVSMADQEKEGGSKHASYPSWTIPDYVPSTWRGYLAYRDTLIIIWKPLKYKGTPRYFQTPREWVRHT